MEKRKLGRTGLEIGPLVFGGNVFGWTVDEKTSFTLLDAFVDAGLNAVDTADVYSAWVPGNHGGESETILGRWFARSPGNRDKLVVITKVGSDLGPDRKGLSARWIAQAVEDSLKRLNTDHIDLYLSHWPDAGVPYEETLGAYDQLVRQGKVRAVGASNLDAAQLSASLDAATRARLPGYAVLQPEYNLYTRDKFEGPLADLCIDQDIGVIPYFSLAAGFLTGKYRSAADFGQSPRGGGMARYLDDKGLRILGALDQVSAQTEATVAEVALAWLASRPGVTAPIASATSVHQLDSLVRSTHLRLTTEQKQILSDAGA